MRRAWTPWTVVLTMVYFYRSSAFYVVGGEICILRDAEIRPSTLRHSGIVVAELRRLDVKTWYAILHTDQPFNDLGYCIYDGEFMVFFIVIYTGVQCFMEPLKKVQVEGFLMFAEPQDLFGNLDELCYVSNEYWRELSTHCSHVRQFYKSPRILMSVLISVYSLHPMNHIWRVSAQSHHCMTHGEASSCSFSLLTVVSSYRVHVRII